MVATPTVDTRAKSSGLHRTSQHVAPLMDFGHPHNARIGKRSDVATIEGLATLRGVARKLILLRHVTSCEPSKDRLSESLDPGNAARFGWQAWRGARARYPRSVCRACPLDCRLSAVRPPAIQLHSLQQRRNPTHGFPGPLSAVRANAASSVCRRRPAGSSARPRQASNTVMLVIQMDSAGCRSSQATTGASGAVRINAESTLVSRMINYGIPSIADADRAAPAVPWSVLIS
jgi:hypothetical protein